MNCQQSMLLPLVPSLFLLWPLLLLRLFFGVLLREARLACAEAFLPALKVFVIVVGSTGSGTLLKLPCDSLSNSSCLE